MNVVEQIMGKTDIAVALNGLYPLRTWEQRKIKMTCICRTVQHMTLEECVLTLSSQLPLSVYFLHLSFSAGKHWSSIMHRITTNPGSMYV
jgi:hypothetical protein